MENLEIDYKGVEGSYQLSDAYLNFPAQSPKSVLTAGRGIVSM
jgi:hypothetical protein